MATYTRTVVVRIGVICGCLLLPLTAAAEPHLRWEAPPECPQITEAKGEIARLLRKNYGEIDGELVVRVSIAAVSGEFEARVKVGRGAERVIRDRDCAAVERAVAVVVALAIEPGGSLEGASMTPSAAASTVPAAQGGSGSTSASASGSTTASTTAPASSTSPSTSTSTTTSAATEATAAATAARTTATASETEAEPEPEPEPTLDDAAEVESELDTGPAEGTGLDLGFAFWAAGGAIVGVLPAFAPGAAVGLGVFADSWRADLRVGYWFPQSAQLDSPPNVGGAVGLGALALDAGPRFELGPVEVPLVAGFEVGLFVAEGENTASSETKFPVWLSTYLGAGLAVPWGKHFAAGLRVEGLVALLRPSFAVQPKGGKPQAFFQPAPVGARALLALELRLP